MALPESCSNGDSTNDPQSSIAANLLPTWVIPSNLIFISRFSFEVEVFSTLVSNLCWKFFWSNYFFSLHINNRFPLESKNVALKKKLLIHLFYILLRAHCYVCKLSTGLEATSTFFFFGGGWFIEKKYHLQKLHELLLDVTTILRSTGSVGNPLHDVSLPYDARINWNSDLRKLAANLLP